MISACIIIIAWTTTMPLWASITLTVLAGLRLLTQSASIGVKITKDDN